MRGHRLRGTNLFREISSVSSVTMNFHPHSCPHSEDSTCGSLYKYRERNLKIQEGKKMDMRRTISFRTVVLLFISIFHTYLHHQPAGADPTIDKTRETLEIVIGIGGGGYSSPAPSPEYQDCLPTPPSPPEPLCPPPTPPPSPTPYIFESKRVKIVHPIIQNLKKKITRDPYGITKTWVGPDICHNYKGFFCHVVPDYNVTALSTVDFNGFNFAGPDLTLTGFIEELPDIAIFHANSNHFTGNIPPKIANLRYLDELDLSNNNFAGEFPVEVIDSTNLTFLDLRFNSFSGMISPQVFTLDLDVLFINNNNFIQKLPQNLGETPVQFLTLANNKFTGQIPRSIGYACKTLVEVLLLNNQLSGCLPYEIGLLNNVTVFDVGCNQLTGPIPYSFGCLAKMEVLNLAQNMLYGAVPEVLCELRNLANLSLSDNYFTEVGPKCSKLIEKNVLDVRMNCISGLPTQRSAGDCEAFFAKPKYCPDDKSFTLMTCSKNDLPEAQESLDGKSMARAALPRSYGALIPH